MLLRSLEKPRSHFQHWTLMDRLLRARCDCRRVARVSTTWSKQTAGEDDKFSARHHISRLKRTEKSATTNCVSKACERRFSALPLQSVLLENLSTNPARAASRHGTTTRGSHVPCSLMISRLCSKPSFADATMSCMCSDEGLKCQHADTNCDDIFFCSSSCSSKVLRQRESAELMCSLQYQRTLGIRCYNSNSLDIRCSNSNSNRIYNYSQIISASLTCSAITVHSGYKSTQRSARYLVQICDQLTKLR